MSGEYESDCGPLLSPRLRQYIDHRTGLTETGFATPGESTPPDVDRPRQAKYELKNRTLSDALQAFANDMQRLEKFYSSIEQDTDAFRHVLYRNENTLTNLHYQIERWKQLADAETERMDKVEQAWKDRRIQLQDILSPLTNGLRDSENPQQEYLERFDALKTVCDKELTELLDYVMTTSEQKQINQSELKQERNGWSWQRQATEYLENEHGLVESEWWGDSQNRKMFTPTEKGKAVYEALEALLQSSYLDEWQEEGESREKAAYKALSNPHNVGI